MNVNDDGSLKVSVNRFENDYVWNADNRHRVVIPKLADLLLSTRQEFSSEGLFSSRQACDLLNHIYNHDGYQAFKISDPKPRDIHKANVRDRLLHHAVYRILYPFFDKNFVSNSYSCRLNKGTRNAINKFREYGYKVSQNNTKMCWVLKCDIKKFFANIDHEILIEIFAEYTSDKDILGLLEKILSSFSNKDRRSVGLPLGNLTSQLLVNIYMNRFDQFVKHRLKATYYIRYADDFVFLSKDKNQLKKQIPMIENFLQEKLRLALHPDKVFLKTLSSGVDFLGIVNFSDHRVLRTVTRRKMMEKMKKKKQDLRNGAILEEKFNQSLQSYVGMFKYCDGVKIKQKVEECM